MDHPPAPGPDPGDASRTEPACAELSLILRELAWSIHRKAPARGGVGPLPTTELALLKQVLDAPGSTVGDLAQALGLAQPNASAALRVLLERGLVTREPHPGDRRRAHVQPTASGAAEHRAIAEAWAAPVDDALATLAPEHRAALADAADALRALYQALTSGPADPA